MPTTIPFACLVGSVVIAWGHVENLLARGIELGTRKRFVERSSIEIDFRFGDRLQKWRTVIRTTGHFEVSDVESIVGRIARERIVRDQLVHGLVSVATGPGGIETDQVACMVANAPSATKAKAARDFLRQMPKAMKRVGLKVALQHMKADPETMVYYQKSDLAGSASEVRRIASDLHAMHTKLVFALK
jgi:hypothetical protein